MEETRSRCPNPKLWCWERTAAWTQRPSFKQLSPVMKIHSNRLIDYLVTLLPRWVWCVHTRAHTCTRAHTHTHTHVLAQPRVVIFAGKMKQSPQSHCVLVWTQSANKQGSAHLFFRCPGFCLWSEMCAGQGGAGAAGRWLERVLVTGGWSGASCCNVGRTCKPS